LNVKIPREQSDMIVNQPFFDSDSRGLTGVPRDRGIAVRVGENPSDGVGWNDRPARTVFDETVSLAGQYGVSLGETCGFLG
jgi:hypothetical protein